MEQRKAEQPSVLLPPRDFPGTSFSVISYLCNGLIYRFLNIFCSYLNIMYQSQVEIEHYSVAYFDRIMKRSRAGLIRAVLNVVSIHEFTQCICLSRP